VLGLYSVPLAGGAPPVALDTLPDATRELPFVEITADAARVVYAADRVADDRFGIYSVPLAGGAAPLELQLLGPDRTMICFELTPDSQWAVHGSADAETSLFEFYAVPLAGGAAVPLAVDSSAFPVFAVTPDSKSFLYLADVVGSTSNLYSIAIDGSSPPRKLNGTLPLSRLDFQVDDGARWVLFHAAPNAPGLHELFVAPLYGSHAPISVAGPLAGVAPSELLGEFRPGTGSVVYLAEGDEEGVVELYVHDRFVHEPPHRRR
jgi:hypothetical protein